MFTTILLFAMTPVFATTLVIILCIAALSFGIAATFVTTSVRKKASNQNVQNDDSRSPSSTDERPVVRLLKNGTRRPEKPAFSKTDVHTLYTAAEGVSAWLPAGTAVMLNTEEKIEPALIVGCVYESKATRLKVPKQMTIKSFSKARRTVVVARGRYRLRLKPDENSECSPVVFLIALPDEQGNVPQISVKGKIDLYIVGHADVQVTDGTVRAYGNCRVIEARDSEIVLCDNASCSDCVDCTVHAKDNTAAEVGLGNTIVLYGKARAVNPRAAIYLCGTARYQDGVLVPKDFWTSRTTEVSRPQLRGSKEQRAAA